MPQIQLTPAERKVFRADAHHLDPVVMIGGDGLTPAVVKETEAALNAHGLIKIRDLGGSRCGATATAAMLDEYRRREAAEKAGQTVEGPAAAIGAGGY